MNIITWILQGAGTLSVLYFIFGGIKEVKKALVYGWVAVIVVLIMVSVMGYNFITN
jgi:hypothetical protein